ncbi:hypothetical protein PHB09_160 [Pseudomonas phage PHB09]|uniref:Uncharacterized protein n=1 Tax=Pseudomonas phage PHB09 TaxID=2867265 RepID=A0AAE8XD28_9CAUD|nr:hypothetical protein QGX10_gp159 [Pseudomonas phage PHB09]UAV84655.1 hypothetical protein PHB09_160 [Pseudomonas phage PHB09]
MILATILTVCTLSCNDYIIDTATTSQDAAVNLVAHSQEIKRVWDNTQELDKLFTRYNISEDAHTVQIWELNTKNIPEDQIP